MSALAFLILAVLADVSVQERPSRLVVGDPNVELLARGSCRTSSNPVDLRDLLILENRSVEFERHGGRRRISVAGEIVQIGPAAPGSSVRAFNVGSMVDTNADLDVDVKLALLGGELVIYWRETFQHRTYRQGLFTTSGATIEPLCEGSGGFDRSH